MPPFLSDAKVAGMFSPSTETPSFSAPTASDAPLAMQRLSDLVAEIAGLIPEGRPVVYLDYPVHMNVGDLLIEAGTDQFFKRCGLNVIEQRSAYDFGSSAQQRVTRDSVILLHGGGNFGDLYPLHQHFRESVIEAFPKNRIVMLPQTMHFDSQDELADCAAKFARHPDLHLCLRDHASHDRVRQLFRNPAYLVPDMAHMLWEPFAEARAKPPGEKTLIFARKDKESRPLAGAGRASGASVDWKDIIVYEEKAAYFALLKMHEHRGKTGGSFSLHPLWRVFRDRVIASTVHFLGSYEAIVTNRLHMAIISLLLGRRVTMADNSYGKLSQYHTAWLSDNPDAKLAR